MLSWNSNPQLIFVIKLLYWIVNAENSSSGDIPKKKKMYWLKDKSIKITLNFVIIKQTKQLLFFFF